MVIRDGLKKSAILAAILLLPFLALSTNAQTPQNGGIRGTVADVQGGLVPAAGVTLVTPAGTSLTARSSSSGTFAFNDLRPGTYTVRVNKPGFAPFENTAVTVAAGRVAALEIALGVTIEETTVTVTEEAAVSTDPEASAGAIVLKEEDIEALPDNPADLELALRSLAGPGSGPGGGEIFIDGFSGGRLPPADTIREIRINQNPFSSEFDRLGLGRIEIFTKPGTEDFRGEVDLEFEDETFNSRNPFAPNKPPFRAWAVEGNISGPLIRDRISYFFDAGYDGAQSNELINAVVIDPGLNFVPFSQAVVTPTTEVEFSPRFDIELNEANTLVARYFYEREESENSGVGGFNLPTRSYATTSTDHTVRLTETAVLSPTVINEARIQFVRRTSRETGADDSPTIQVLDAFTGGGANVGDAFVNESRFELFNSTSVVRGRHTIKFGGRLRHASIENSSPSNFAGTFTFTSIQQYRDTILNLPGAYPTQFAIAGGEPLARVKQTDLGIFVQDDWRYSPKLTLSLGLRYEKQTNLSDNGDFAPRFAFAYAPGAGPDRSPKTVFRGGFGLFYERFGESLTLQANRFNGVNQQRFIVTDPAILDAVVFTVDGVSGVPSIETLSSLPQTTRLISPDTRSPYTVQTAFGVERQLPLKSSVSASYIFAATNRLLRSRNINAPINGVRPVSEAGNLYQYESTGRYRQHQIVVNGRTRFIDGVSLFANYAFATAKSDSDGPGTFPAFSYDLSGEYGDAASDIRHRFSVGGNFELPFGIEMSPFLTYRTGIPFNIITGIDSNNDSVFTERPTFGQLGARCAQVGLAYSYCNAPGDDTSLFIPRNYGRGPDFFVTNLRVSREFGFGSKGGGSSAEQGGPRGGGGSGRGGGGISDPLSRGGGGQRPTSNDDDDEPRYRLEVQVFFRNLFNSTNPGTPVGNLGSPFFGRSLATAGGFGFGGGNSSAGNRRIEFELEFGF